jgi:predicted permease
MDFRTTTMEWFRRLLYFMNRRKLERELQEEMKAHREMMSKPRDFGNMLRLREESQDMWGWAWLDDFQRDCVYAFRSLTRTPVFTLASILMLAVGIGLNLTVFQVGNTFFLQPLPLKALDSLVRFDRKSPRFQRNTIPYEAIRFISTHQTVLSDVMMKSKTTVRWSDDVQAQPVAFVSSNWFSGLGYGAIQGRALSEGIDDLPGAPPAIVISEWFWKQKLGGVPGVVGSMTKLNDRTATIVGIVPGNVEEFSPTAARIWLPIEQISYFIPGSDFRTRWDTGPEMYARLKAGVSPAFARDTLRPVMADLASQRADAIQSGEWLEPFSGRVRFEDPARSRGDQMRLLSFSLLAGLTLLVACANLGNLVLSRNLARMQEIRIRMALGASRSKVLRHLLAESVALAGLGCVGGLAVCSVAQRLFFLSIEVPFLPGLTMDWRMAAATLIIGLFTMATIGLMPAWRLSRKDEGAFAKSSLYVSTNRFSQTRMRNVLVGLQVMLSCVLLVVGGGLTREMRRAAASPRIAFETVAVMEVALDQFGIRNDAARAYWRGVEHVLAMSPEVERTSLVEFAPFGQTSEQGTYKKDAPGLSVIFNRVDASYFALFGIPVLAGRTFESNDDTQAVIISKRLAEKMYGGIDAVGKPFPKGNPNARVIGVVADAQTTGPKDNTSAQQYRPLSEDGFGNYRLVVRAKHDPRSLLPVFKTAARAGGSGVTPSIHLLRDDYERANRANRTVDLTIVAMALIALAIASLGIFGVVSYSVALRQKEFGIRLAIGANRRSIVALVLGNLLRPVLSGILLGIGVSVLARLVLGSIAITKTSEPLVLVGVVVIMLMVTGLATLLPTLRALRANAIDILRWDS